MDNLLKRLIEAAPDPRVRSVAILDGASPAEYRGEFARRVADKDFWQPAALLAAYYVDEIAKDDNVMDRVDVLAKRAKLGRALTFKYVSLGRLILRRIFAIEERPVPAHLANKITTMQYMVEVLALAKRLGLDPLDVLIALEQEPEFPEAKDLARRKTLRKKWTNSAGVREIGADIATYEAELEKGATLERWECLPPFEWCFVSSDGYYRAAEGKSEVIVGYHWDEVMVDRPVIFDGKKMSCRDAWAEMVLEDDDLYFPSILVFPNISGQFSHRQDAAGVMELLVVRVQLRNQMSGFLFIDFGDSKYLSENALDSWGRMRSAFRPVLRQLEERLAPGKKRSEVARTEQKNQTA